jgi:hypothetical protein
LFRAEKTLLEEIDPRFGEQVSKAAAPNKLKSLIDSSFSGMASQNCLPRESDAPSRFVSSSMQG